MDNFQEYMIISASILGAEVLIYFPITVFILQSKLKRKNLDYNFKSVFNYALKSSIFTYLVHLNTENTQVQVVMNRNSENSLKRQQTSLGTPTREQQIIKSQITEDYNNAIICNCYECFCDGCPWEMKLDLVSKVNESFDKIQNYLFNKLKYQSFIVITILTYIYLPLNNLMYYTNSQICQVIFGITLQIFQFYVQAFTFSFISTKREMVRVESEEERALLIYYHLRKAFIFSWMVVLLLSVLTIILAQQFEIPNQESFFLFNSLYSFICYLVLFLLVRFNKCLKNDLIQDNDKILKEQQRLYAIENNLIKYFPSDQQLKLILNDEEELSQINETKESIDKQTKIDEFMDSKLKEAKENLQSTLNSVEAIQFKKIKKNLGVKKCKIITLTIYIYLNLFIMMIYSLLVCLIIIFNINGNNKDNNDAYQNLGSINPNYFYIPFEILTILQFTFFPYLIGIMFNKKALFGQDYGKDVQNY